MVDNVLTKHVLKYDIMEALEITDIKRFQRYLYKATGSTKRCYVYPKNTSYMFVPSNEEEFALVSKKLSPYVKGHLKSYTDNYKHSMKYQGLTDEAIQSKITAIISGFAKEFSNHGKTYEYSSISYNGQQFQSTQALQ